MFSKYILFFAVAAPLCAAHWDWRFADPSSNLIAGSAVTPTSSNPIAFFFVQRWTPLGRLPAPFQPLLSRIQTVTYSAKSSREEITVLTGAFDLAALRSAAATAGMTSRYYSGVEILASAKSNWDQIALINANTLVFGVQATLDPAITRWKTNSFAGYGNALIQKSATFASTSDLFAIGSRSATLKALLGAKAVSAYLANRAPSLGTQLKNATGFTFRAALANSLYAELNITEPDAATATLVASALSAIPGQIKAKGAGAAELLTALNNATRVHAAGPVVEVVIDLDTYPLTTVVSPPQSGTIQPPSGELFFAANSSVALAATPGACYGPGVTWSSNAPGGVVFMSGPQTVTATFSAGSAATAAAGTTVTPGLPRFDRATGRYQQLLAVNNTGAALSNVSVIFDNLPAGVALYNPDGTTVCAPAGAPYRNLAWLPSGWSSQLVEFTVATPSTTMQYSPRVVAGVGSR